MSLPAFVRRASAAAIALLCGVGLLTGGRVVSGAVAAIPAANGVTAAAPSNLLADDDAGLNSATGGWIGTRHATVAAVATPTHTGAGALAVIAAPGTGVWNARLGAGLTDWVTAVPGSRYTSQLWVTATTTARDVSGFVYFADSKGKKIDAAIGQVVHDAV